MGYRVLAEATMLVHFTVLAYIIFGGFLAWWRRWLIVPHVVLATWGLASITVGVECPLTVVEDWSRRNAGEEGLGRGFIDTYLGGLVYPQANVLAIQLLMTGIVAASWLGLAVLYLAKRRRRAVVQADPDPDGGARLVGVHPDQVADVVHKP